MASMAKKNKAKKNKKTARHTSRHPHTAHERDAAQQRAQQQAWIDTKLAATKTGMRDNTLLLLLLVMLYSARGAHFAGLNQIIGLVTSFFAAQLIVDSFYFFRRQPKPENIAHRIGLPLAITAVIFGAMLLTFAP